MSTLLNKHRLPVSAIHLQSIASDLAFQSTHERFKCPTLTEDDNSTTRQEYSGNILQMYTQYLPATEYHLAIICRASVYDQSRLLVRNDRELQWEVFGRGDYEMQISRESIVAQYFGTPRLVTRNGYETSLPNLAVKSGANKPSRPITGGAVEDGALQNGEQVGMKQSPKHHFWKVGRPRGREGNDTSLVGNCLSRSLIQKENHLQQAMIAVRSSIQMRRYVVDVAYHVNSAQEGRSHRYLTFCPPLASIFACRLLWPPLCVPES